MLVDSHAHLNFPDFADIEKVIADAKAVGVEKIINIGTSLDDSKLAIGLARKYEGLYATVGIHPNDPPSPEASEGQVIENIDWEKFEELARMPKVVAIGECGLDYSRISGQGTVNSQKEKERQRKLFQRQIEIAAKLNLPLSIHIRDAQDDLIELFSESLINRLIKFYKMSGVFHCFSGDQKYLESILGLLPDFYISFAGNLTFKNSSQLQQLAQGVPLQRLLVETDCPFLAPEPHRGERNEPANVKITAEYLARLQSMTLEEIAKITTLNAEKLFSL